MTKKLKLIGAALVALALLPAAVLLFHISLTPATLFGIGFGLAGTVTVTYESFQHTGAFGGGFTGGSATAPTAAQAKQISAMSILVNFTDTDTVFSLTHNWGLSAAQAAALLPQIIWDAVNFPQALGTQVVPALAFTFGDTNVIGVTKLADTGSGCTIVVYLRRPHSLGF